MDSIQQFIPARNELIEVFGAIALYDRQANVGSTIHRFFELLIPYLERPEVTGSFHRWDWDNLKFIVQESFIICISIFLKYERFDVVSDLLKQRYFVANDRSSGQRKMKSFGLFRNFLDSFDRRNQRLRLNRLSVHADVMKERCTDSGLSFNHVMQADFVLYFVDAMEALKEGRQQEWWPETLVFSSYDSGVFEIFLRAESIEYFTRLAPALGVTYPDDFKPLIEAIESGKVNPPKWDFNRLSPVDLINFDSLCSRE